MAMISVQIPLEAPSTGAGNRIKTLKLLMNDECEIALEQEIQLTYTSMKWLMNCIQIRQTGTGKREQENENGENGE
jgi:hypothetical protein